MSDSTAFTVNITGVEDLVDMLNNVGPRHSRNLMRASIHGVAGRITKQAKINAPKNTGVLKKAIYTKRKKSPPTAPVSEVRVKEAAFYWRFHEYGSKNIPENRFVGRAAEGVKAKINEILVEEFGKKLEAALKREFKRNNS